MLNLEKLNLYSGKSGFISKVYYLEEIDSTNAYAKSLENETDLLAISDFQTRGFGRMERKWESEKGKNLTFTIKKHFNIEPENVQAVNFYFSYFLLAYVRDFILKNKKAHIPYPDIYIKWPNDILFNSKKISGLLIEDNINKGEFCIGIGINLNQDTFAKELNAYSLKEFLNEEIDITDFLIGLIRVYEENIGLLMKGKYDLIYKLWKNGNNLIGKEIFFICNEHDVNKGKIIDLLKDGGIKIEQNNQNLTFYSGEIKLQLEKYDGLHE